MNLIPEVAEVENILIHMEKDLIGMFDRGKAINMHEDACEERKKISRNGPWTSEPNRCEWEYAGMHCLVVRNLGLLHWCGYVGIPKGHPDYGKDYDDIKLDVHGGLTYGDQSIYFISHATKTDLYWFGFDCAHVLDICPGFNITWANPDTQRFYRNFEYVKKETESLAEQLAKRSL